MTYTIFIDGETCPQCGHELESLVNSDTGDLAGERCPNRECGFDNLFVTGATWPEGE